MAWSSKRGRTDSEKFPWLRRALSEGGWRRGPETRGGEGGAAKTPTDWQQLPSHVGEKKRAGPDAGTPRGCYWALPLHRASVFSSPKWE